jgi:Xaa-Pro aminopeptidase
MRYTPIPSSFFIERRKLLADQMPAQSVALFFSNYQFPTNADGTFYFKQNSDLFYFTGIDQADTVFMIYKEETVTKSILFIKETNEHIAVWEGNKLSKPEASHLSGIETVYWSHEYESQIKPYVLKAKFIGLNLNEHSRADSEVENKTDTENKKLIKTYPLHEKFRTAPICASLRMIKSSEEIHQIKKAIDITHKAFNAVVDSIRVGMYEFELEGIILAEFIKNRSRQAAYQSIVATGENACVLHYIDNNSMLEKDQAILMDFGAEYGNYCADLTRVLPTNKKFTTRQKEVYESVYRIFEFAKKLYVVGNSFSKIHQSLIPFINNELIALKLITQKESEMDPLIFKKYFMHGIGHHLGLDVHDVNIADAPFVHDMVLTLEPGIYIKEEKIGIRLENNILISNNGPIDLMENIPLKLEEIEKLF